MYVGGVQKSKTYDLDAFSPSRRQEQMVGITVGFVFRVCRCKIQNPYQSQEMNSGGGGEINRGAYTDGS